MITIFTRKRLKTNTVGGWSKVSYLHGGQLFLRTLVMLQFPFILHLFLLLPITKVLQKKTLQAMHAVPPYRSVSVGPSMHIGQQGSLWLPSLGSTSSLFTVYSPNSSTLPATFEIIFGDTTDTLMHPSPAIQVNLLHNVL